VHLFAWLISHQPQYFSLRTNQPSATLFSQNKSAPVISHQLNEQAGGLLHSPRLDPSVHNRQKKKKIPSVHIFFMTYLFIL
jgi:hypothetical protein